MFQSTHPRGVRRRRQSQKHKHPWVSIHAPARGATRLYLVSCPGNNPGFNPRTREGCDTCRFFYRNTTTKVSIHAPARGATVSWFYFFYGCLFQSTHPRGVRQSLGGVSIFNNLGFNPRTREGCDVRDERFCFKHQNVSIHAPARGATPIVTAGNTIIGVSIHAPARGATPGISRHMGGNSRVSIHAPARGATSTAVLKAFGRTSFNPRTREGCDDGGKHHAFAPKYGFQSTHPRGVRPPKAKY